MRKPDWNCHLVESVGEAQAFLTWLSQRRPVLAFDTETTGLHPWTTDTLRMVQFGDGQDGWAISYRNWRGLIEETFRRYDGPIVGHNLPFDLAFIDAAGLPVPQLRHRHDTMVLSHLIDPARSHGLKQRGDALIPGASAAQFDLKSAMTTNKWNWATVPEDFFHYWVYAASDVCLTAHLFEDMRPQVTARGMDDAYVREMVVQDIAYRMQKRGLLVDTDYTSDLLDEWLTEMAGVEADLHALGVENPSAGQQVAQALQLTEKWEPDAWTDTGLPKVDEKVLLGIDSEIARKVLRYRRLRKWTAAYLQRFLSSQDKAGRVHPDLKPLRARTGRWSITGPALQTLPRGPEIRNCIIPDAGQALWGVDQSNVEMRLLAHYAQDPLLLEAVRSGENLHVFAGRTVYNDPSFTKDDPRYTLSKNTQFCLAYGGGPQKIADTAGVSVGEARAFHEAYLHRFPGVQEFLDTIDRVGRQRLSEEGVAYIRSWGGRYIPASENRIYALTNYTIQSSASDIFKEMLIDLDAAGFSENMLLPVHDEVIFQFPEGEVDAPYEAAEIMTWEEGRGGLQVPLGVGVSGPAERWGSLEK